MDNQGTDSQTVRMDPPAADFDKRLRLEFERLRGYVADVDRREDDLRDKVAELERRLEDLSYAVYHPCG